MFVNAACKIYVSPNNALHMHSSTQSCSQTLHAKGVFRILLNIKMELFVIIVTWLTTICHLTIFIKKLHFRYLTGFWSRHSIVLFSMSSLLWFLSRLNYRWKCWRKRWRNMDKNRYYPAFKILTYLHLQFMFCHKK